MYSRETASAHGRRNAFSLASPRSQHANPPPKNENDNKNENDPTSSQNVEQQPTSGNVETKITTSPGVLSIIPTGDAVTYVSSRTKPRPISQTLPYRPPPSNNENRTTTKPSSSSPPAQHSKETKIPISSLLSTPQSHLEVQPDPASSSSIAKDATTSVSQPLPLATSQTTNNTEAATKLAEALDDFLGDIERKFKGISEEILARLDEMAERCDRLEGELMRRDNGLGSSSSVVGSGSTAAAAAATTATSAAVAGGEGGRM